MWLLIALIVLLLLFGGIGDGYRDRWGSYYGGGVPRGDRAGPLVTRGHRLGVVHEDVVDAWAGGRLMLGGMR